MRPGGRGARDRVGLPVREGSKSGCSHNLNARAVGFRGLPASSRATIPALGVTTRLSGIHRAHCSRSRRSRGCAQVETMRFLYHRFSRDLHAQRGLNASLVRLRRTPGTDRAASSGIIETEEFHSDSRTRPTGRGLGVCRDAVSKSLYAGA